MAWVFFGVCMRRRPRVVELLLLMPVACLGTWVPDWDLAVGGIGSHRHPLSHSALPAFLLHGLSRRRTARPWPALAVAGMAIGVGSHLLWDTVDYGNVVGIPGRMYDSLFLLTNMVACLGLAAWLLHRGVKPFRDAERKDN